MTEPTRMPGIIDGNEYRNTLTDHIVVYTAEEILL
jgi:hypothetical protein